MQRNNVDVLANRWTQQAAAALYAAWGANYGDGPRTLGEQPVTVQAAWLELVVTLLRAQCPTSRKPRGPLWELAVANARAEFPVKKEAV